MIDRAISQRAINLANASDCSYSPEKAVQGIYVRNKEADNLTIFFPPWHGGGLPLELLKNRMAKAGQAVLSFSFHDQILEPNIDRVLASFDQIHQTASEVTRALIDRHGYKRVRLFGMSLGTVSMAKMAADSEFDSACVVVGSSNLAKSMWEGLRTEPTKRDLEAQGVTIEQVDEAWQTLAPKNYVKYFNSKEVAMYLSQTDKIIPSQYQTELADCLAESGAYLTTDETRLGHYAAAARFCLAGATT